MTCSQTRVKSFLRVALVVLATFAMTPPALGQGWFGAFGGDAGDKDAEKSYRHATSAYGSADYAKVVTITSKIIEKTPSFAKAYALRGKAYKDMGEVDKAYADLSQAIKIDPSLGEAYFIRGQVSEINGALDEAKKDYVKACANGYDLACL